jgi:hypothetical protein
MKNAISQHDMDLLSAYIDGELGNATAESIEERLKTDPDLQNAFQTMTAQGVILQRQSDRHRQTSPSGDLTANVDAILARGNFATASRHAPEQSDPKMRQTTPGNVLSFPSSRQGRVWTGIAVAATIMIAFVGGGFLGHSLPVPGHNTQLAAFDLNSSRLDMLINETLETTQSGKIRKASLSSDGDEGSTVIEPLRTFQQAGKFCREYRAEIHQPTGQSTTFFGRACRDPNKGWETVYRLFPGKAADIGLPKGSNNRKL